MAICSSCGGSGIKRVSEQRFRTCQDCLGSGELQTVDLQPKATFSDHSAHTFEEKCGQSTEVVFKAATTSAFAR